MFCVEEILSSVGAKDILKRITCMLEEEDAVEYLIPPASDPVDELAFYAQMDLY